MNKLLLGVTDTHDHLAHFFISILGSRYDIELVDIDKETPDILLFGDDNFGNNNTKFSRDDCVKLLYTGENRRPENFDCDYAISFDHNFEPRIVSGFEGCRILILNVGNKCTFSRYPFFV